MGNVLLAPVENKVFEIPQKFLDHISSLDEEAEAEIKKLCGKIKELVDRLGISNKFSAVVTDGDLSIGWEDYWKVDRRAAKSVSDFLVTQKAVLNEIYRVHPSSCLYRSSMPKEGTYIHLWTIWSPSFGLLSGASSSTRKMQKNGW
jgi:hypothetical protein